MPVGLTPSVRNAWQLARSLEGCYGLDVLEGKGSGAKCAAAQGNNCQDSYMKLYPTRMFLDAGLSELMRPVLDGTMAAVNATLPPHGQLSLRDGEGVGEIVTGEAQVLRFKGARSGHGDRMHVHIDKKGTRWVAIMSMGETSTFIL